MLGLLSTKGAECNRLERNKCQRDDTYRKYCRPISFEVKNCFSGRRVAHRIARPRETQRQVAKRFDEFLSAKIEARKVAVSAPRLLPQSSGQTAELSAYV
jgi:hypothetical protein